MKKRIAILLCLLLVFTMLPSTALAEGEGDGDALTVEWNGQKISSGTIEIEEGRGYSLPIYVGDELNESSAYVSNIESTKQNIWSFGVNPDNNGLELYLSPEAKVGDTCKVTLTLGNFDEPSPSDKSITLDVEVIAGVKLKIDESSFIVAGTEISGKSELEATVWYGEAALDGSDFEIEYAERSAVYDIKCDDSSVTITTVGNGREDFAIIYKKGQSEEKRYNFTWIGSNVENGTDTKNVTVEINGESRHSGESFNFRPGEDLTGKVSLNGSPTECKLKLNEESIDVDTDGSFTIKNLEADWYKLKLSIGDTIETVLYINVSEPYEYVLQFYNMGNANGSWQNVGGMGTMTIFKGNKEEKYVKFVVTDENMRRIDNNHFVNVTKDDIKVLAYYLNPEGEYGFNEIGTEYSPFSFEAVANEENMLKITYDRSKDKYGPVYKLEYVGSKDKYLSEEDTSVENKVTTLSVYTRKLIDIFDWDAKHECDGNHWKYDARLENHDCYKNDANIKGNSKCDVKSTAVEIPSTLLADDTEGISMQSDDNQITITEETLLDIETDLATVTLDDKVLTQVKKTGENVTLDVVKLEADDKEADEYKNMELGDADVVLDLTLEYEDGTTKTISDFGTGKVTVKLDYTAKDASKTPKVYYIDQNGNKTEVECTYENGTISFDTNHFSVFAVVEEVAGTDSGTGGSGATGGSGSSGGGAAIGAGTGSSTEIGGTDAKTEEELKAEQLEKAQQGAAKAAMKARSSKTSKGNIKIVFIPDEETEGFIKEMEALGYTVKYKFYRSTKKTSGYKAMLTKSSRSYTNTSGVKGKMYYYKTRVQIFDKDGKLIAQTALKQCKYANRLWTK